MIFDDLVNLLRDNFGHIERGDKRHVGLLERLEDTRRLADESGNPEKFYEEVKNYLDSSLFREFILDQYGLITTGALLTELERESKLFLLDYPIVDSLYGEPHGNLNYADSIRLPFPSMFFEFEEPLRVSRFNHEEGDLAAMIFRNGQDSQKFLWRSSRKLQRNISFLDDFFRTNIDDAGSPDEEEYDIDAIYTKNGRLIPNMDRIVFDRNRLPSFQIYLGNGAYCYDSSSGTIEHRLMNRNMLAFEKDGNIKIMREFESDDSGHDFSSPLKIIDLVLNTINYVNAQNIIIQSDRGKRKVGRGRQPPSSKKPYYWVEVKKTYVQPEEFTGKSWQLNYRVWVRGHFRHYQNGNCSWIQPYVKGPENAPWKHNRYKLLYEKTIQPFREGKE